MVRLKLLGYIAELAGFRERNIELYGQVMLRQVLKLPKELDFGRIIILVNGMPAPLNLMIKNEDEIVVMPMLGGGS